MPFFPVFIDLSAKKVLVVGGGMVATRKVENILRFTKNIKIVAPKIRKELSNIAKKEGLQVVRRPFRNSDLSGVDLVVVAVNKISLQKRIFRVCERRGILCNSVDSPELCNFVFPALVVRGDVSIGISTAGKAPALSKRLRELIEACLPDELDRILEKISEERKKRPKGKNRQRHMLDLVDKLIPLYQADHP